MARFRIRCVLSLAIMVIASCLFLLGARTGLSCVRELPSAADLRSGDVILLGSATWRGRLLNLLDSDSLYAHTGILEQSGGVVNMIHADPCRKSIVREPLKTHLLANDVERILVLRVDDVDEERATKAVAFATEQWKQARRFDNTFRYCEGDGFYCTELVLRSWSAAGVELLSDVGVGDSVFPSKLCESSRVKRVLQLPEFTDEYLGTATVNFK